MKIFKQKWFIGGLLIGMLVVWFFQFNKADEPAKFTTEIVTKSDLTEIVSELGTVEAQDSVSLSFGAGGNIERILVKENETVSKGQVLATLDRTSVDLKIAEAEARLRAEEARLRDLRQGPGVNDQAVLNESLKRAEKSFTLAKQTAEDNLKDAKDRVEKAHEVLYSSGLTAFLVSNVRGDLDYNYQSPTISGNYKGTEVGNYDIELYASQSETGYSFRFQGLEKGTGVVSINQPVALGQRGLYISFPVNFARDSDLKWRVEIPNTRSAQYLTLKNSYETALSALKTIEEQNKLRLAEASSALDLARAQNTQSLGGVSAETLKAQEASVSAMRASVEQVRKAGNDLEIRAPFSGLITKVNLKSGERANPGQEVMQLVGEQKIGISVLIPETEIVRVKLGDSVKIKFDALLDEVFSGEVVQINQVAVNTLGVPQFLVKVSLDKEDSRLRVGMSTDLEITTAKKNNVLALPSRTIVREKGEIYVRQPVSVNSFRKTPVSVGLRSVDGLVEVISGLNEGDEVITYLSPNDLQILKEVTD